MNIQLNLSSVKWLFLNTTITLIVIIITSAQSTKHRYTLPVLPESHYMLTDVIVLPENSEVVEITITSMITSKVLASLNLTSKHEFRLGYGVALQNVSVESGLQLITSCRTTVVIDLPDGLITLPSSAESGNIYHIFPFDNSEKTFDQQLVIQSEIPNINVIICGINNHDEIISEQDVPENNKTDNCSTLSTSDIGIYLLNGTFKFSGIQITSEHPISVFKGHSQLSSLVRNTQLPRKYIKTSYTVSSETIWNVIPASSNHSATALLIPSDLEREYTFSTVCPVKCSIVFHSGDDLITVNMTKNTPIKTSFTIPPGRIMTVTMKRGSSVTCIKPDNTSCNDEILSINAGRMVCKSSLKIDHNRTEYNWIYISNETSLYILLPNSTDFIVTSLNGNTTTVDPVQLNIENSFYKLTSLSQLSDGLYIISTNGTIDSFEFFSVLRKQTVATNYTPYRNTTPRSYNALFHTLEHYFKTTPLEMSTVSGKNSTKSSKENKTLTQTAIDLIGNSENVNSKDNTFADRSDPNSRFKAVVDIIHSNEGRKDILIDKSKSHEVPTFTYRFNENKNYEQGYDGKNPVAIIASLLSAILAVGAIILIFLLKDFFSRRQNIRKTRIRPFISHY